MREKIITYENIEHTQKLDANGNIEQQERKTHTNRKVETEPDFIKLYIKDICKLNDIPTAGNNILNELLKYTNYDNKVLLPMGVKKIILDKLNISLGTLNNNITKLIKKEILKRIDTGIYMFNPYLFGRGNWKDIKEIRTSWTYNNKGRALSGLEVDKVIEDTVEEL